MITKTKVFTGTTFEYANEKKTCTASGEYQHEDGTLVKVDISGRLTKDKTEHAFWANVAADGHVNISGVAVEALPDVATEVSAILSEIKAE